MEKDYWLQSWKENDIAFHQSQINPRLIEFWAKLEQPHSVFVPLCGKSKDLLFLREQGAEVFGCELSPIACRDFFEENKIEFRIKKTNDFEIFQADRLQIFCGDFFKLKPALDLPTFDAVYDRAALIALPPPIRKSYAEKLKEILKASKKPKMLLLTIEYDQDQADGPPFSVAIREIEELYKDFFEIRTLKTLSDQEILRRNPKFDKIELKERILLLGR